MKFCRNPKCGALITFGRSDKKFCNASCKSMADRIKNQPTIKKLQYQNIMIKRNEKILETLMIQANSGMYRVQDSYLEACQQFQKLMLGINR